MRKLSDDPVFEPQGKLLAGTAHGKGQAVEL